MDKFHQPQDRLAERAVDERLDSWKEIAVYLKRGLSTVQRWEKHESLPVHRLPHDKRDTVYAYRSEIDAWLANRGPELEKQPTRWRMAIPWSIAVVMAVVAGVGFWILTRPAPRPLTQFVISLPPDDVLYYQGMSLSVDGRNLVYVAYRNGVTQLYRRSMDQLEVSPIPGTEGAEGPFFSPDGQWVGFFADGKLKKVSLSGGPPVTLCDAPSYRRGASWGQDNNIVFSMLGSGLLRVPDAGGIPQAITALDFDQGEIGHHWMDLLPGDKAVLFTAWFGSLNTARIAVQSIDSGDKTILAEGTNPRYASTGHVVFAREGLLWAVPFDLDRLEVTGSAVPVLEGVRVNLGGWAQFAFARDGSLVYIPRVTIANELVWVEREGKTTPLTKTIRGFMDPRFSPDGEYLSVTVDDGVRNTDIWLYEIARRTFTPLTFGETSAWPIWTLDGKQITFGFGQIGVSDVFSVPADGSGEPERLTTSEMGQLPSSWSPDGVLAYQEGPSSRSQDIWVLSPEGEGKAEPFVVTEFSESHPMFSPDGRWIAFTSNRSGRNEVYVKPYPGEGSIMPISTEGGNQPLWARDGEELFYRNGNQMMVVSVQTQPTFKPETPRLLFEGSYSYSYANLTANYDVTPDGQRFVMIKEEQQETGQIIVFQNWFEELKRLVPTN